MSWAHVGGPPRAYNPDMIHDATVALVPASRSPRVARHVAFGLQIEIVRAALAARDHGASERTVAYLVCGTAPYRLSTPATEG